MWHGAWESGLLVRAISEVQWTVADWPSGFLRQIVDQRNVMFQTFRLAGLALRGFAADRNPDLQVCTASESLHGSDMARSSLRLSGVEVPTPST